MLLTDLTAHRMLAGVRYAHSYGVTVVTGYHTPRLVACFLPAFGVMQVARGRDVAFEIARGAYWLDVIADMPAPRPCANCLDAHCEAGADCGRGAGYGAERCDQCGAMYCYCE